MTTTHIISIKLWIKIKYLNTCIIEEENVTYSIYITIINMMSTCTHRTMILAYWLCHHIRKKHVITDRTEAFCLGKHLTVHAGNGSSLISFLIHRHIDILIPGTEEPLALHTASAASQLVCKNEVHVNETNLH